LYESISFVYLREAGCSETVLAAGSILLIKYISACMLFSIKVNYSALFSVFKVSVLLIYNFYLHKILCTLINMWFLFRRNLV